MAKKKHNQEKKLHNSLHNSDTTNDKGPDLSWQEAVDLLPEDEAERGSETYYFTDENGNIHSREFLAEELIPDESEAGGSPKRKLKWKLQKLKPGAVDVVSLVGALDETPQQVTPPAPKSGAPPAPATATAPI